METSNPLAGLTFAEAMRLDEALAAQIQHIEVLPPKSAVYGEPSQPLSSKLEGLLANIGVKQLYSHQAQVFDQAVQGKDVFVVTGTNSGKTLCYNLPVMESLLSEPVARALYLFPTKALAQDQLGKLQALLGPVGIRAATYDGDTPRSQRSAIRNSAQVILTNPDMLHLGILPGHENWGPFLRSLRFIVIDEMHTYRGIFGSHVANVIRRLLRLCEFRHSSPTVIGCSATIGNPEALFRQLVGRKPVVIDGDGAPDGRKSLVFWNPPLIGAYDEGDRFSANKTTAEIVLMLGELGLRSLAFNRARVSAELVLRYIREGCEGRPGLNPQQFESYRAGYTPKERRDIEKRLFKGDLRGLSATNAMELGIDLGDLDAVILNGYPGTISSFWQQVGRAGRGAKDSLAIYVAHDDPLEQYLIREPARVLDSKVENVAINPENKHILPSHLLCAAYERPIGPSELAAFGDSAIETAEGMDRAGELEFRAGRFYYPSHEAPAGKINLRGSSGQSITLLVNGQELGSMERWRAMQGAHEGAIYLHRGQTYLSKELNLEAGIATLVAMEANYYTQPIVQSVLDPQYVVQRLQIASGYAELCSVKVTDLVTGFRRKSLDGDSVLGMEDLDLPSESYETLAVRFGFEDKGGLTELKPEEIAGVHGVEHALMALAPLLAGCDRADLGSAWYSIFHDRLSPAVFIFDRAPGGVGLAERLFDSALSWVRGAHELVSSCRCENGCPACLLSARCEANNEMISKPQTLIMLDKLGGAG
ncbi:MAG: DEAD/DEAH box helicase [Armatimonadetes bacterium]|nr:DEAD/DEAH box helicase [Armatimonadota bacterium]